MRALVAAYTTCMQYAVQQSAEKSGISGECVSLPHSAPLRLALWRGTGALLSVVPGLLSCSSQHSTVGLLPVICAHASNVARIFF